MIPPIYYPNSTKPIWLKNTLSRVGCAVAYPVGAAAYTAVAAAYMHTFRIKKPQFSCAEAWTELGNTKIQLPRLTSSMSWVLLLS